jgi:Leucine rich repeat
VDLLGVPEEFRQHVSGDGRWASLANAGLTSVPEWLSALTALTELDLSGNELTALPGWLGNLTTLTQLDLWYNRLTSLPDEIGRLTGLTQLDLSGNQLTCRDQVYLNNRPAI